MKNVLFGAVLATLLIPMPARAQGDHRVHLTIGGGFTMPVSDIDERFDTGGGFNIGMTIETGPVFEIQTEYSYNALAGKDKRIPLFGEAGGVQRGEALIESHHAMHYINFNGVLKTAGESKVKPYGVGGGGMYYRSVSLTTPDVGSRPTSGSRPTAIRTGTPAIRPQSKSIASSAIGPAGIRASTLAAAWRSRSAMRRSSTSRPGGTICGARSLRILKGSSTKPTASTSP
jgi:hypothetical protein